MLFRSHQLPLAIRFGLPKSTPLVRHRPSPSSLLAHLLCLVCLPCNHSAIIILFFQRAKKRESLKHQLQSRDAESTLLSYVRSRALKPQPKPTVNSRPLVLRSRTQKVSSFRLPVFFSPSPAQSRSPDADAARPSPRERRSFLPRSRAPHSLSSPLSQIGRAHV